MQLMLQMFLFFCGEKARLIIMRRTYGFAQRQGLFSLAGYNVFKTWRILQQSAIFTLSLDQHQILLRYLLFSKRSRRSKRVRIARDCETGLQIVGPTSPGALILSASISALFTEGVGFPASHFSCLFGVCLVCLLLFFQRVFLANHYFTKAFTNMGETWLIVYM